MKKKYSSHLPSLFYFKVSQIGRWVESVAVQFSHYPLPKRAHVRLPPPRWPPQWGAFLLPGSFAPRCLIPSPLSPRGTRNTREPKYLRTAQVSCGVLEARDRPLYSGLETTPWELAGYRRLYGKQREAGVGSAGWRYLSIFARYYFDICHIFRLRFSTRPSNPFPCFDAASYFVQSAKFSDAAPDGWIAAILFRMKHVRITRWKRGELLSTT